MQRANLRDSESIKCGGEREFDRGVRMWSLRTVSQLFSCYSMKLFYRQSVMCGWFFVCLFLSTWVWVCVC